MAILFSDRNLRCEHVTKHLLNVLPVGTSSTAPKSLARSAASTLFLDEQNERWNVRFAEQAFPEV